MSSDTLAEVPAVPQVPGRADTLTIAPQRRPAPWTAAR